MSCRKLNQRLTDYDILELYVRQGPFISRNIFYFGILSITNYIIYYFNKLKNQEGKF